MSGNDSGRTSPDRRSTTSSQASSTAIDPSQLLSLCYAIRENMDSLDRSIRLVQMRLASLNYARTTTNAGDRMAAGNGTVSPAKCLADLANLNQLSQALVRQLDELQVKLNEEDSRLSISFHVASQQLAFFTSEWYDNLTPKFRQTLELAEKFQLIGTGQQPRAGTGSTKATWFGPGATGKLQGQGAATVSPETDGGGGPTQQPMGVGANPTETRVREALVRLKQSVSENERLIASIASNLDYTKTTIEAIYQSLRATKVNLELGEQNALESIQVVRSSERSKLWATLICAGILMVALLIVFRLVGII